MPSVEFSFRYTQYDALSELERADQDLIAMALEARSKAYAPYSGFSVGAALLLDSGEVICGNNQENAAFPAGLCAERVALFSAMSSHPEAKIIKIAVVGGKTGSKPRDLLTPCGSCRQALLEYEQRQQSAIPLIFQGQEGAFIEVQSIQHLMPFAFGADQL